ncbi:Stk1 family PASTA domain-containing Ser/Thr kinase [Spirillospora sp. CA-294931]|uniref:Stk1 family PASTA domain-containing Ser/Thr kinase n=1 Tax=Spirillospora sp. CA-294931 TaxID=3240042 RepID=UPI003D8A8448
MDATATDPLVGLVLDGRYRIESRVARGGMATVYVALDLRLDRTVALKVMHGGLAADDDFVARFIGEAKAAAALSHHNVVAVYDQRTDGEHVFLVMEYVPGRTLRDLLEERGRLGPGAALEVLQPVLAALGAAHRRGLVHRDVKPENVLIHEDGRVKVADFGLARAETASKMTKTGMVIGTVGYLAPEQVLSGNADVRSDVYAAGVLLFELLTGVLPHQGDSPLAVAYKHVNEDVRPPSELVAGLPAEVDALVQRAMSRDPAGRPDDADALLGEVATVRAALPPDIDLRVEQAVHRPTAVLDASPTDGRTAMFEPEATSRFEPPPRTRADRAIGVVTGRYVLIALGMVAAMILAWAVWWQTSGQYDKVPDKIIGMRVADARKELQGDGISVRVLAPVFSERVRKDAVARSAPGPGARIAQGETVTLTPSKGRAPRDVPDVSGKTEDEAKKALKDKGFTTGATSSEPSQTVDKGRITRTDPPSGEKHSPDVPVKLIVSSGMSMPSLVGRNADDAANQLRSMGLNVDIDKKDGGGARPNTVLSQDPEPGTGVSREDSVTLVISKKDCLVGDFFCKDSGSDDGDQIPVPTVIGRSFDDARSALEESGFQVRIGSRLTNRVVGQNPVAGNAARDSVVTIWG